MPILFSLFLLVMMSGCSRKIPNAEKVSWKEKFIHNYLQDIAEQAEQEERYPINYPGPNNSPFRNY